MGSRSCQGDVQAATQILQSNWWWTHSEAGIFRTRSSQDNQERGYLLNENGRKDML